MASKVSQPQSPDDIDDLAVLFPSRQLTLAGVAVTVHEYTLREQLQYRLPLKTLSDAFAALLDVTRPDGDIPLDTLFDVLAVHDDAVIEAIAVSCGQPVEWVAGLTGEDSDILMMIWWSVNADFFTRAALRPAMEQLIKQVRAGAKSSPG